MIIGQTACCGIREIENLSDFDNAKDAMLAFCEAVTEWRQGDGAKITKKSIGSGLVIFTGVVSQKNTYVQNFKKFIDKNKLGPTTISTGGYNPNHPDHMIKMVVWVPDANKLTAWWGKKKSEEEREVGLGTNYYDDNPWWV